MTLRNFYRALTEPLTPRFEAWVRRVFGVGQALLACLLGTVAVRLILELDGELAAARPYGSNISDAGGIAFAVVVYGLIPAVVLLTFGAVAVWRNRRVKWWLPLLVMLALSGLTVMILR